MAQARLTERVRHKLSRRGHAWRRRGRRCHVWSRRGQWGRIGVGGSGRDRGSKVVRGTVEGDMAMGGMREDWGRGTLRQSTSWRESRPGVGRRS
jgi:hypothetical protein